MKQSIQSLCQSLYQSIVYKLGIITTSLFNVAISSYKSLLMILLLCMGSISFIAYSATNNLDTDNDGVMNAIDVDVDGDGLIEISSAYQLNMLRNNLQGTGLSSIEGGTGISTGCGGGTDNRRNRITACSGYELVADIDLDAAGYTNWEPVGTCGSDSLCRDNPARKLFSATFEGNNHSISNLNINITTESYGAGLFGAVASNTKLRNIHIQDGNIIAPNSHWVGSLVGWGHSARISSSTVTVGEIRGDNVVGGLVGNAQNGLISSSTVTVGDLTGAFSVGGLVSRGVSARISSSTVTIDRIRGTRFIGGLIGWGQSARISSSTATVGEISGNSEIGGLVGNGQDARISASYAVIKKLVGSVNVGGLAGEYGFRGSSSVNVSPRSVTDSYWDSDVLTTPDTRNLPSNKHGSPSSTSALQTPTEFGGIYANWDNGWCNPATGEYMTATASPGDGYIRAWDLGTRSDYPALNCLSTTPAEQRDIVKLVLADTDGDGISDYLDDTDNDGYAGKDDNCPFVANNDQADANNDGEGDVCDDTDNDGVVDAYDEYPTDNSKAGDHDGDGIDSFTDLCLNGESGWTSSLQEDQDGDGCRDSNEDVDVDGDGLIEISTADQLNMTRNNLEGSGLSSVEGEQGISTGCGGGTDNSRNRITTCSGYELMEDIDLADAEYTNWEPIGTCGNGNDSRCGDNPARKLFDATFDGNNHTISNLNINIRTTIHGVGLFGAVASNTELRNIHIRGGNIIASNSGSVGGLVGYGGSARISSSTATVGDISGTNYVGGLVGRGPGAIISSSSATVDMISGSRYVGGLIGNAPQARISSSTAIVGKLSGDSDIGGLIGYSEDAIISSSSATVDELIGGAYSVGGLVGDGRDATISSSTATVGDISGGRLVGGLVGYGGCARISSSTATVGEISGSYSVGGLVGYGYCATISSSTAIVGEISGGSDIGGLVGNGKGATMSSSSATVDELTGNRYVGGLVGNGRDARISYSYAVTNSIAAQSDVGGLVGASGTDDSGNDINPTNVTYSYWDSGVLSTPDTRNLPSNTHGSPRSTSSLQSPTGFSGIYENWGAGWCNPATGEYRTSLAAGFVQAWDLGTADDYPALNCLSATPAEQRSIVKLVLIDTDGDGTSDYLDDADNDGSAGKDDNCPFVANNNQADFNDDGEGDACNDTDGDGVVDAYDEYPTDDTQAGDHDNDGIDSITDPDDDGDGVEDAYDLHPQDNSKAGDPDGDSIDSITDTDDDNDGFVDANDDYPIDNTQAGDHDGDGIDSITDTDDDGDGLIEISTADELNMLRNNLQGTGLSSVEREQGISTGCGGGTDNSRNRITTCSGYELVADIDLLAAGYTNWEPIGTCGSGDLCRDNSARKLFSATFDGNNHSINNLNINIPTETDGIGLFGAVAPNTELSNIRIRAGNIIAPNSGSVGGLVGYGGSARISASTVTVDELSGSWLVGGLVGSGVGATISSSTATVNRISGTNWGIGGLVGYGNNVRISSSTTTVGEISGSSSVGGLVGSGGRVIINSSLATIDMISGGTTVGGLVGYGPEAIISSSYAVTNSIDAPSDVGGLVGSSGTARNGFNRNPSNVTASYWDDRVVFVNAQPLASNLAGTAYSTSTLQSPTEFDDIYATWGDGWCNPATGEYMTSTGSPGDGYIQAWDLGTENDYPALNCLPATLTEQRNISKLILNDTDGDGISDYFDDIDDLMVPIIDRVGSATSSLLRVSWQATPRAVYYQIYRDGSRIASRVTGTSYIDSGLSANTGYNYRVSACNNDGCSEQSEAVNGETFSMAPSVPSIISVASATSSSLRVSWQAIPRAAYYQIYRDGRMIISYIEKTSYNDSGLSANTGYSYRVSACTEDNQCSPRSTEESQSTLLPLPRITSVGSATSSSLRVAWGSVSGATYYQIYRDGSRISSRVTGTSYTDRSLSGGTYYGYRVSACNANGCSSQSVRFSGRTLFSPPRITSVGSATSSSLRVAWGSVSGATYYQVYRDGSRISSRVIGTSYIDRSLSSGTTYSYNVSACNANGCSSQSVRVSGRTLFSPPWITSIGSATTSSLRVVWSSVSGATYYQVYRDGSRISSRVTGTSYTDRSLSSGTVYSYNVSACNANGCSSQSVRVSARTLFSPPRITSVGSATSSSLRVAWSSVSGAGYYKVYRNNIEIAPRVEGTTSYTDRSLTRGRSYGYRVSACNTNGCSSLSSTVTRRTSSTPLISYRSHIRHSSSVLLDKVYSSATATVGDNSYLFTTSRSGSSSGTGVSSFYINKNNNGRLSHVQSIRDTSSYRMRGAIDVKTVKTSNGNTYVFVAGFDDDAITSFRVDSASGRLTFIDEIRNSGTSHLDGPHGLATGRINGIDYLFVATHYSGGGGISALQIYSDGSLAYRGRVGDDHDNAHNHLYRASDVVFAEVGGIPYIMTASHVEHGINVFRVNINRSGSVTFTRTAGVLDRYFSSYPLYGALTITAAKVGSSTYIFVGGYLDDGVTVFRVNTAGSLTFITQVIDRDNSNYHLDEVRAVSTHEVGGTTYLLVAGRNDDGISIFRVNSSGTLNFIKSVEDSGSRELDGAASISSLEIEGKNYLFVGGHFDDGVSVIEIE